MSFHFFIHQTQQFRRSFWWITCPLIHCANTRPPINQSDHIILWNVVQSNDSYHFWDYHNPYSNSDWHGERVYDLLRGRPRRWMLHDRHIVRHHAWWVLRMECSGRGWLQQIMARLLLLCGDINSHTFSSWINLDISCLNCNKISSSAIKLSSKAITRYDARCSISLSLFLPIKALIPDGFTKLLSLSPPILLPELRAPTEILCQNSLHFSLLPRARQVKITDVSTGEVYHL